MTAMRHIGMYLDYEHVYGRHPTWNEAYALIAGHSPRHLLNGLCFIATRLSQAESGLDMAQQVSLIRTFFPTNSDHVLQRAEEVRVAKGCDAVAVFGEVHLRNVAKLIILKCDEGNTTPPPNWQCLGDLFLAINELTDFPRSSINDEELFLSVLIAMSVGFFTESFYHSLARSFNLFLVDRPHLTGHPSYIDLPTQARSVLGCEPFIYWTLLFAIYSRLMAAEDQIPHQGNLSLQFDQHLAGYRVTDEELVAVRKNAFQSFGELQRLMRARYSNDIMQFDHLILSKTPIVQFTDSAFWPSRILVEDKLRHGLYHLHLDSSLPEDQRHKFHRYFGAVFADYSSTLLRSIYGSNYVNLDETVLGNAHIRLCDAAIKFGNNLVLVEFKSGMVPVAARSGANWDTLTRCLKDSYIHATLQLDATARLIEQGRLRSAGILPEGIERYLPLIVIFYSIPMSSVLYDRIIELVNNESGFPSFAKVQPVQMMSCEEMECLGGAHANGDTLDQMFLEKAHSDFRGTTFRNYWHDAGVRADEIDEALRETFDACAERAIAELRSRQTESA